LNVVLQFRNAVENHNTEGFVDFPKIDGLGVYFGLSALNAFLDRKGPILGKKREDVL
jgi:hypothetical protein